MANHKVREKYTIALKTFTGSDGGMWLAQCNTNCPALSDQHVTEVHK
jgi:hypothetical protein